MVHIIFHKTAKMLKSELAKASEELWWHNGFQHGSGQLLTLLAVIHPFGECAECCFTYLIY